MRTPCSTAPRTVLQMFTISTKPSEKDKYSYQHLPPRAFNRPHFTFAAMLRGTGASLVVQLVKNPPATQETWV